MKLISLLLITCLTWSFINAYNYNDPLGLDPEPRNSELDDIITGDEIADIPTNFIESKLTEEEVLRKYTSNFHSTNKPVKAGFLDSVNYSGRDIKYHMRFTQKSLAMQENDFFNKEMSNNDPNKPIKEIEMLRKEGLSNGIVKFDRKRVCNWETSKYPEYYMHLRKD